MRVRPRNVSVHTPRCRRSEAPLSTGVAVSRPDCELLRSSSWRTEIPSTPNIIQTTKQTMKAKVETPSVSKGVFLIAMVGPLFLIAPASFRLRLGLGLEIGRAHV